MFIGKNWEFKFTEASCLSISSDNIVDRRSSSDMQNLAPEEPPIKAKCYIYEDNEYMIFLIEILGRSEDDPYTPSKQKATVDTSYSI